MRHGISELPLWQGGQTDSLVIIGEQGIGDEVFFASIIPEAMIRCKKVTYCCDERLITMFERSLPGLKCKTRYVDARDDLLDGDYTAYVAAGDLLPLFRQKAVDFPRKSYLKPDPARLPEMEKYRGKTAVAWRGRHGGISPLALREENLLSIQYDDCYDEVETPHIDLRNDLEGLLALLSVVGRVVSVPASPMHFSGALGVPTEVIIAPRGTESDGVCDELDWHCPLYDSPWYPNTTTYKDFQAWKNR
jgi:hypothetical protein